MTCRALLLSVSALALASAAHAQSISIPAQTITLPNGTLSVPATTLPLADTATSSSPSSTGTLALPATSTTMSDGSKVTTSAANAALTYTATPPPATFAVTSPASGATETTNPVALKGTVQSNYVNVAGYNSTFVTKICPDFTPSGGAWTLSCTIPSGTANGTYQIGIAAFTVPAGQGGGSSESLTFPINWQGGSSPPPSSYGSIPAILATLNPGHTYAFNAAASQNFQTSTSLNSALWGQDNCCVYGASYPYNLNGVSFSAANGLDLHASSSGIPGISTLQGSSPYNLPQNGSYVEITAQLSPSWPAFWLNCWNCSNESEIDIFENWADYNVEITVYNNTHTQLTTYAVPSSAFSSDPTKSFHTYGFYYGATEFAVVIDGAIVWTWPVSNYPNVALPIILDNGYCTGASWCGSEPLPTDFYIQNMQVFN